MIEPTGEMKAAFRVAQEQRAAELVAEGAPLGGHDILDRGLAAVLALVERDYDIRPRHTAGAVAAAPDNYVIERHPDGRVTTHYVGPTTADVLAAAGRQDTRPTGAQLRDAQDGVVIHIPGDGPLSQPAPDAASVRIDACPDCASPFRAHRYVLPVMTDGVHVGNRPCQDPWHDRPLTITKNSPSRWPAGRGGSHPHFCVSCSDGQTAGLGCGNCRSTGMDQTPWPACQQCAQPSPPAPRVCSCDDDDCGGTCAGSRPISVTYDGRDLTPYLAPPPADG